MAEQGVVLDIDAKFLDNLKKADKALSNSAKMAGNLTKAFQKTLMGSGGFATTMQQIYAGLSKIGGVDFSTGVAKINTQARTTVDAVNLLTANVAKLKSEYNSMLATWRGSKAKGTHLRITDESDLENIAKLRSAISQINNTLNNKTRKKALSLVDIESLNRQKDLYKRALSELTMSDSRRTDMVIRETNKRIREIQKEAKATQEAAASKYTKSPASAISYANQAKSINEMAQAIKYLETVRDRINSKTKSGAKDIERINRLIGETRTRMDGLRGKMSHIREEIAKMNQATDRFKGLLAAAFSISAIRGYVNQIIKVRGEFELQQRALQAIIQNKAEANELWNQTVQLAVKSPFQVKQLVTYTKQLAAYRVETDKLHDTTKMLADISAGLGVDMGRLILAFGQVKTANYLRGTELRQFSEAGINILDELARYYTVVEGKAITVGQAFERVSKRMVSFEDVETVLKNVTSAGGMFYQMQEIQAETLKGSISNLKDQLDLMLNDIGEENEAILKGGIRVANVLIKNWRAILPVLSMVAIGFTAMNLSILKAKIGLKALTAGVVSFKAALLNPLTLILALVGEIAAEWMRWNAAMKNIEKENARLIKSIDEIGVSFNDAMDDKKIDDARISLTRLWTMAKNDFGIDLSIDEEKLKEMDFSALEEEFRRLNSILYDASNLSSQMKESMVEVGGFWQSFLNTMTAGLVGNFGENLNKNLEDYESASTNLIAVFQREANSLKLPKDHPLRARKGDNETEVDYINRLVKGAEAYGLMWNKDIYNAIRRYRKGFEATTEDIANNKDFAKALNYLASQPAEVARAALNSISATYGPQVRALLYDVAGIPQIPLKKSNTENGDVVIDGDNNGTPRKDTRWQDLLRTIKEVNQAYKDLNKTFDATETKQGAIEKYTEALNDVLNKVAINGEKLDASQFMEMFDLTTEGGMLAALDMIAKEAPDAADKLKAKLEKGEITWEVKIKTKEAEDKKLTNWIEDLFSGYELSIELEKLNVPRDLAKNIFNLDATTLGEVRSQLIGAKSKFTGEKQIAEYEKALRKIDELEDKAQQERLKKYVKYLVAGQGERVKIKMEEMRQIAEIESLPFDDAQKELAREAVRAEANKRIEKLDWEEFKDSGMYVRLFEDLEFASSRTLKLMREKLIELKSQLSDLDADDLKHLYDQIEKLDNELVERNPYKALAESAGGYFKSLKRLKDAEAELVASQGKQADLDSRFSNVSAQLSEEKRIYEQMSKSGKASAKDLDTQREKVGALNSQLLSLKAQLAAQGKLTKELEAEIDALTKARKMFTGSAEEIGRDISEAANALPQVAGHLENVFGTMSDGTRDALDSIATIGGGIGDAIAGFASGNYVQAIMGVAQAIGGIFAIGDKAKERKIQRELKHVDELDKRYQEIDEALDRMYNSRQMAAYTKELNDNIDSQIESYERMRALEEDKKKSDQAKIDEYNQSIEDLNKRREEMFAEQQSKATGGILDDALSAAEGFVDAWYDAFQETGDGLFGLENNFKDMLSNLMKKQAAMQIVGNFTKQYSDWLKDYINAEARDPELTAEEARKWAERVQATFPELSNMLENFFSGTQDLLQEQGELSELSKGIQGITESTAQVLEALLNSMRFYVADSNVQLKNIANALISNDVEANPLLNELRQQTAMIRSIESMFDSVIGRGGSSHSGGYVKVLIG